MTTHTSSGNDTILYVTDGQKFYEEIRLSGGAREYREAEPGLTFVEIPGSQYFVAVRDREEAARQRESSSHVGHFSTEEAQARFLHTFTGSEEQPVDPEEAKRRMRRLQQYEGMLNQIMVDRVAPVATGMNLQYVTDEQFIDMHEAYRKMTPAQQRESPYQPVSAYYHKLMLKKRGVPTGQMVRPLYQGEVGMLSDKTTNRDYILVLKQGYGTGNLIAVPGSGGEFTSGSKTPETSGQGLAAPRESDDPEGER